MVSYANTAPAIVTLTRFPEIFDRFRASAEQWEPGARKVVVASGGGLAASTPYLKEWVWVEGVEPFVFARNANLGLAVAGAGRDVLLVNDDCELVGPVIEACRAITEANSSVGLVAPLVIGGCGNKLKRYGPGLYEWPGGYYTSCEHLSFVCVYVPARTREIIGELDERFDGYGDDDRDYCRRVQDAGLTLAITPRAFVRHGFGGCVSSSSFLRVMTRAQQDASKDEMHRKFDEKYPQ